MNEFNINFAQMLKTQTNIDDGESSDEDINPETVNKATFMRPQSGKST